MRRTQNCLPTISSCPLLFGLYRYRNTAKGYQGIYAHPCKFVQKVENSTSNDCRRNIIHNHTLIQSNFETSNSKNLHTRCPPKPLLNPSNRDCAIWDLRQCCLDHTHLLRPPLVGSHPFQHHAYLEILGKQLPQPLSLKFFDITMVQDIL